MFSSCIFSMLNVWNLFSSPLSLGKYHGIRAAIAGSCRPVNLGLVNQWISLSLASLLPLQHRNSNSSCIIVEPLFIDALFIFVLLMFSSPDCSWTFASVNLFTYPAVDRSPLSKQGPRKTSLSSAESIPHQTQSKRSLLSLSTVASAAFLLISGILLPHTTHRPPKTLRLPSPIVGVPFPVIGNHNPVCILTFPGISDLFLSFSTLFELEIVWVSACKAIRMQPSLLLENFEAFWTCIPHILHCLNLKSYGYGHIGQFVTPKVGFCKWVLFVTSKVGFCKFLSLLQLLLWRKT